MSEWNGEERRKMNQLDHDLLMEIKNDTRHLVDTMITHVADDKVAFKVVNDKIGWLQKGAFMAIGALVLIELMLKFK